MEEKHKLAHALTEASRFHDWDYEYSDDFRCWSSGNAQRKLIDDFYNKLHALDPEFAVETWNSLAPKNWKIAKL